MTQSFDGVCGWAAAAAVSDPPGAGELAVAGAVTSVVTGSFSGTCDLALVTLNRFQHLLVEGSVVVSEATGSEIAYAATYALTPDRPCDLTTASGHMVVDRARVAAVT